MNEVIITMEFSTGTTQDDPEIAKKQVKGILEDMLTKAGVSFVPSLSKGLFYTKFIKVEAKKL